jgi:hypothetical protein
MDMMLAHLVVYRSLHYRSPGILHRADSYKKMHSVGDPPDVRSQESNAIQRLNTADVASHIAVQRSKAWETHPNF